MNLFSGVKMEKEEQWHNDLHFSINAACTTPPLVASVPCSISYVNLDIVTISMTCVLMAIHSGVVMTNQIATCML